MKHTFQAKMGIACGPIGIILMLLSYVIATPFDLLYRVGLTFIIYGSLMMVWAMVKEKRSASNNTEQTERKN